MSRVHDSVTAIAQFAAGCCVLAGGGAGLAAGLASSGALAQLHKCLREPKSKSAIDQIADAVNETGRHYMAHTYTDGEISGHDALLAHLAKQLVELGPKPKFFVGGRNKPSKIAALVIAEMDSPHNGLASKAVYFDIVFVVLEKAFTNVLTNRVFYTGLAPSMDGANLDAHGVSHTKLDKLLALTQDKGAQKRIEAAEARLRSALESMSEAFIVWDAQQRLIMCNRKFSDFFGIDREYLQPGTSYEDLAFIIESATNVVHVGKNKSSRELEMADGRWVHFAERKTAEGGLIGIGTDISDRKKAEALLIQNENELTETISDLESSQTRISELAESYRQEKISAEEASRSKSEFLADMSHELRTPLNAINGFSEIMYNELLGPIGNPRYREFIGDILASGQHLLNLINDILDMSKIESNKMVLYTEVVYCDEMVKQCVSLVRKRANESNLKLLSEIRNTPVIEADPRAIKQVFLNVLSNAIKFTPKGGTIKIETQAHGKSGGILVKITDTGIGIPAQDLLKLGTPFLRIENQHHQLGSGTGLGLALTRSFVELHGGKFIIESEVGIGTSVTIQLPSCPPKNSN
ncbi:MAG: hypothetical protein COA47_17750 [Robiginitomaculum sp.]|nr:MAG: hypothetical protein COA47_17750 [Robiginitomaculum sp.]